MGSPSQVNFVELILNVEVTFDERSRKQDTYDFWDRQLYVMLRLEYILIIGAAEKVF